MKKKKNKENGQTAVEYILLTFVILSLIMFVMRQFTDREYFFKNLTGPLVSYLRYNYKYADPTATGWDEGNNPKRHIQISQPNNGQTFRLFTSGKR